MATVARTAGAHSTSEVLLGLVILIWALGTVSLLARRLSQLATRSRHLHAAIRSNRRLRTPRDDARSAEPGAAVSAAAPTAPAHACRSASLTATNGILADESSATAALNSATRTAAIPQARVSPDTLAPLARSLDTSHRLAVAEARVAQTLAALPPDRWLIERYVLIAGHRIPFLILGETGVIAIWPLTGPPLWDELPIPSHVAAHIAQTLPGYPGAVQV